MVETVKTRPEDQWYKISAGRELEVSPSESVGLRDLQSRPKHRFELEVLKLVGLLWDSKLRVHVLPTVWLVVLSLPYNCPNLKNWSVTDTQFYLLIWIFAQDKANPNRRSSNNVDHLRVDTQGSSPRSDQCPATPLPRVVTLRKFRSNSRGTHDDTAQRRRMYQSLIQWGAPKTHCSCQF